MIGRFRACTFWVVACMGICLQTVSFGVIESIHIASVAYDDHQHIEQVQVGVPFCIQVTYASSEPIDDSLLQQTTIPGFKQVSVQGVHTQSSVRMVQKSSKNDAYYEKHRFYTVVCQHEGDYVFGPVSVANHDGSTVSSQASRVQAFIEVPEQSSVKNEQKAVACLLLSLDNKQPFVGQKVHYTVAFEAPLDQNCSMTHDMVPSGDHVRAYPTKAYRRRFHKNRKAYQAYVWEGDIVFELDGEQSVGPFEGVYTCSHSSHVFPSFMHFGSLGRTKKRGYTNAETVFVKALPEPPREFTGIVGKDIRVRLYKDDEQFDKLAQSDAFSYSLEFIGDADFERFEAPGLLLPDSCKQYKASCATEDNKKVCHYTVQVTKSGPLTIPEQVYVYFDTDSESYKKIAVESFEFVVQKSNTVEHEVKAFVPENTPDETRVVHDSQQENNEQSLPDEPAYSCIRLWSLSLPWLVFLICVLPLWSVAKVLGKLLGCKWRYFIFVCSHKKKFNALKKTGECVGLANFFFEYIADFKRLGKSFGKPTVSVSSEISLLAKKLESYRYAHMSCSQKEYDVFVRDIEKALFSRGSMRALQRYIFVIVFMLVGCFYTVKAQDARQVAAMRTVQWHVSYPEYQKGQECFENNFLHDFKDDSSRAFLLCIWLMPWIFWQLLFVLLCVLWFIRPKAVLLVLILCCGMVVGYGYISRHTRRICVSSDQVAVLAGPASTYTQNATLSLCRQGYEKKTRFDQHGDQWVLVSCGDIFGWVRAQDVYRYTIASLARDL